MSWDPATPNTGASLSAESAAAIRQIWQKVVDVFDQNEDYWARFEGSSENDSIVVVNETADGKGLKYNVTSRAGYYGPGKSGDSTFDSVDDFEKDFISNLLVQADFLRNATSINQRADEYMGTQNEIKNGQARELGKWMGREKSARIFMTFRLKGGPENFLLPSGCSTEDDIITSDVVNYNEIISMEQTLKPLGGVPCSVAKINGVDVMKYVVVGTNPSLVGLKQDPDYQRMLRDAAPRENMKNNPLWAGGYADLDGHRIAEYNPIDHDGAGPIGSGFNAKAFLGNAIAAGTGVITILGGGNAVYAAVTNVQYFRFFPNYAFEFLPNDVYTPGTSVKYFLIVNPPNAPVDPGKVCMYSYTTGNTGNSIVIVNRLGPTDAGAQVSTLGSVTWNTGVWANKHTQTHPLKATIVLCNAKGVPIGDTIMMGSRAIYRAYGSMKNKRSTWPIEGGFQERTFITSVFGQALRTNVTGVIPGYVRMRSAISYPGLRLPVVTS